MVTQAYTRWKIALMEPDKLWTKQEIYSLIRFIDNQQSQTDLADLDGNNLFIQFRKLIRYLEAEGLIGLNVDPALRRELIRTKDVGPGFMYWVDIGRSGPVFKVVDPDKGYKVFVRPRKGPIKLLDSQTYGPFGSNINSAQIETALEDIQSRLKSLKDLIT